MAGGPNYWLGTIEGFFRLSLVGQLVAEEAFLSVVLSDHPRRAELCHVLKGSKGLGGNAATTWRQRLWPAAQKKPAANWVSGSIFVTKPHNYCPAYERGGRVVRPILDIVGRRTGRSANPPPGQELEGIGVGGDDWEKKR